MSRTSTPTGRPRAAPWLALAGFGALWYACAAMNARQLAGPPAAALGAGLLAWIAASWWDPPAADLLGPLDAPCGRPRRILLVLAVLAAGVAAWRMPPEELRLDGVAAWIAAAALWVAAWWPRRVAAGPRAPARRRWCA
ncbi:MAG TPA: hypothetical protein VFA98_02065 [Thermoanaerobaculia bacterium]|nr:hypothetical protein [Thermoanaerobaculia bacterium]